MLKVLKNKNITLLLLGRMVSVLGNYVQQIVLMWYILKQTNSPLIASFSLMICYIPRIFLSPFGGIFADKYNKKIIMAVCDFISGIFAIVLGLFVFYNIHVYIMILVSFCLAIVDTFFQPASLSIVPEITDDEILGVNSLSATITQVSSVIGPIIGGFLFGIFSPSICFFINGISFIISGLSELLIKTKNRIHNEIENLNIGNKTIYNIKIGFQTLIDNKFLLYTALIGGGLINFFLAPISIYIPVFINDYLHLSSTYYGIVSSCIPAGGIFISLVTPYIVKYVKHKVLALLGFFIQGISLILFGLGNSIYSLAISMFIFGCSLTIVGISIRTIYQEEIPQETLGKSTAASMTISYIATPLGYMIGGFLIEKTTINLILFITGCAVTILAVIQGRIFRKINK